MAERYAIRDLSKCTKDCVCLFVCPTGATDTETGQIDADKCIGCGACVDACPAKAISLLPRKYPQEQVHQEDVSAITKRLAQSKARQEMMLRGVKPQSDAEKKLKDAFIKSNRVMAEDLLRESGYMIPQGPEALKFLKSLRDKEKGMIREELETLLKLLTE